MQDERMSAIALRLEHSVEVDVSLAFAWSYRTDITTWKDPPATFSLQGPFEAGSRGTTLLPNQAPLHWLIREVHPKKSFVIEMPLDRAIFASEWRFESVSERRIRMTQSITLSGENANAYVAQVESGFGPTLPEGMKKIAMEMSAAAATHLGRANT
jgi:hypothetical protein